ncbi:MAG: phosphomannomutase/phosphoglucomutase [Pseudomonadota bacterium]|nr:phosphomannomutase/phosphoglucomutase [Pseudomonadota bacterium]
MTPHQFNSTILREYDIRGLIDKTLTYKDAEFIGRAFGTMVADAKGTSICVGYDGRLSSPDFERAVIDGVTASGLTAIRIGLVPTPMLYYAVHKLPTDAGIMITGSHNPPDYNGFKFMMGKEPFFGKQIQQLGTIAANGSFKTGLGLVREQKVQRLYVDRLLADYNGERQLKLAWDSGNGAAGKVMSELCSRLPGQHILLNVEIDGNFPSHLPDPTLPAALEQLRQVVLEEKCDFGIAFDGDGDRIGVVDNEGQILWGDQLLTIFASEILKQNPGAKIIADVKASQVLFEEVTRLGGEPILCRTGHSFIKEKMLKTKALLAGEMSGHIFFSDKYFGYDDALYAAIRLLSLLSRKKISLANIRKRLPKFVNTSELRFECNETRKFGVIEEVLLRTKRKGAKVIEIDGVRVYTQDGWWLLRASNTENALVARCEAKDNAGLMRLCASLLKELKKSGLNPPELINIKFTDVEV